MLRDRLPPPVRGEADTIHAIRVQKGNTHASNMVQESERPSEREKGLGCSDETALQGASRSASGKRVARWKPFL